MAPLKFLGNEWKTQASSETCYRISAGLLWEVTFLHELVQQTTIYHHSFLT